MERNRRVAKAYVRSPTIMVGGGEEGFDGLRIGLDGFGNPLRDQETERVKRKIGVQVGSFVLISCDWSDVFRRVRSGWKISGMF